MTPTKQQLKIWLEGNGWQHYTDDMWVSCNSTGGQWLVHSDQVEDSIQVIECAHKCQSRNIRQEILAINPDDARYAKAQTPTRAQTEAWMRANDWQDKDGRWRKGKWLVYSENPEDAITVLDKAYNHAGNEVCRDIRSEMLAINPDDTRYSKPEPLKAPICFNCKWQKGHRCHYNPPVFIPELGESVIPYVDMDDFCSKWELLNT